MGGPYWLKHVGHIHHCLDLHSAKLRLGAGWYIHICNLDQT